MAQTWTDTTYKLDGTEITILTIHEGFNQVSLYVPGYSLDGRGFSVYFSADHIELLEDLLAKLKQVARRSSSVTTARNGYRTKTKVEARPALPVPVKQTVRMAAKKGVP